MVKNGKVIQHFNNIGQISHFNTLGPGMLNGEKKEFSKSEVSVPRIVECRTLTNLIFKIVEKPHIVDLLAANANLKQN